MCAYRAHSSSTRPSEPIEAVVSLILKYDLLNRREYRDGIHSALLATGNKESAAKLEQGCWEAILCLSKACLTNCPAVISDICLMSALSESTVKRQLRKLEQLGVVDKHADDNDRRRQFVVLTRPYRKVLDGFVNECAEEFKELIEHHDRRERDKAEEALRESEERFRTIFESTPVSLGVATLEGKILACNDKACLTTGYSSSELKQINVRDLYQNANDREKTLRLFREQGRVHDCEVTLKRKDGTSFTASLFMAPLAYAGEDCLLTVLEDVTERKLVEDRLRLRGQILENMAEGVSLVQKSTGKIVGANPKFEAMFGYEPEELIGHSVSILNAKGEQSPEETTQAIISALKKNGCWSGRIHNIKKDGTMFWCHADVSAFDHPQYGDVWISVHQDITERICAEEVLTEKEEKYRNLVETSNDLIWSVNTEGEFTFVNAAAKTILGYEPEEMVGKSLTFFKTPAQAKKDMKAFAKIKKGKKYFGYETEYRKKDGSFVPMGFNAVVHHDKDGKVIGTMGTARDISIYKRHEKNLFITRSQAEHTNQIKSEFLANLSHDLRTPMTAIMGFSDMILSEVFGKIGEPHYEEYVSDINDSAGHLLKMINDLLDIAKIEAGKMEIHEEEVDVSDIVDFCVEIMKPHAKSKHIELKTKIPEPMPSILCDQRVIRQIVLNLVSNAVKFTQEKGWVAIWAETKKMGTVTLGVSDNGPGIASEDIKAIMEPYVRLNNSATKQNVGTGLGVPLSKMMTELHGGKFEVESRLGEGTVVSITLPQERVLTS